MVLPLVAAAFAASLPLTVRQDCDAAGGLPTAAEPLRVVLGVRGSVGVEASLGTLGGTTATTSFTVLLDGRLVDVRVFEIVAWNADGKVLARTLADVDLATGTVLAVEGEKISVGRVRSEEVRAGGDEAGATFRVPVELHDDVATGAAMVTLTDVTGDGALVGGDAFEQALALGALSSAGRTNLSRWTFDDAHGIDSVRQQWSGTVAVDAAWDGAEVTFSADADRCLPAGVAAPADGTITWTEALRLQGSAKKPKWKSVTLGLREPDTETWAWPFSARVDDAGAEGVYVRLVPLDGATKPRSTEAWVKVPALEQLSGTITLGALPDDVEIDVSVRQAGAKGDPPTLTVIRFDGRIRYEDREGAALPGNEVVDGWEDAGWVPSVLSVSGPEDSDWDGTLTVSVRGPAVWDDVDATVTVRDASTGKELAAVTKPLTDLESTFEGSFLFDADPSGGTYRWECTGCGDGFAPFEVQARFGIGTRTSAGQANNKAELL